MTKPDLNRAIELLQKAVEVHASAESFEILGDVINIIGNDGEFLVYEGTVSEAIDFLIA